MNHAVSPHSSQSACGRITDKILEGVIRMFMRTAGLGLAAAVLAAIALAPVPGSAAPLTVLAKPADVSQVQAAGYYKRRYWRRDRYVEPRGETYVAAPFARVYNGRYGTWVRAPFVNLWVPR
jgi:hypothetical protein